MQRLSTSIARGSTLQKFCTGFSRMFGKNSSGFSGLLKVPGIPWDFWGFLRIPKDYWGFYGVKIMGIFGILWESARILGASLGFSGTLQKVYGVSGVSSPSINNSYPLPFLSPWLKKKNQIWYPRMTWSGSFSLLSTSPCFKKMFALSLPNFGLSLSFLFHLGWRKFTILTFSNALKWLFFLPFDVEEKMPKDF